ncbi:MAG: hypothetical protein EOO32_01805 [Comamonadaceae bacterium]|nr:MAG: hypothetical protein EOO32_01805 [Comamonadaceae bacterium]
MPIARRALSSLPRAGLAVAALSVSLLAACSSKPPVPEWQMNAHGSAQKAIEAYLSGDTRVADLEWSRARAEVARTGRPDRLARLELMRCAAQVASLDAQPCAAFEALRADAPPTDQAYADYLAGRAAAAAAVALLPPPQRAAATDTAAVAGIADPLSRLVAAGAAVQAGRATAELAVLATDTASDQGWRRPLLAWLLLRAQSADQAGDAVQAAALRKRIELVERQGAPR